MHVCVYMHFCLYVCMSACMSVHLSACLSVCLFVCMSVCISTPLSFSVSVCSSLTSQSLSFYHSLFSSVSPVPPLPTPSSSSPRKNTSHFRCLMGTRCSVDGADWFVERGGTCGGSLISDVLLSHAHNNPSAINHKSISPSTDQATPCG